MDVQIGPRRKQRRQHDYTAGRAGLAPRRSSSTEALLGVLVQPPSESRVFSTSRSDDPPLSLFPTPLTLLEARHDLPSVLGTVATTPSSFERRLGARVRLPPRL
jgi:hypothetical protein